jgi:transcription initiation factor TFIIF subunit beta
MPAHQQLPKEYNMDVVNHDVHNTFVFTEQDLPSFAAKNKERAAALAQGIPAHLLRKQYRQTEQTAQQGRRTAPYSRRPIPSPFLPISPIQSHVANLGMQRKRRLRAGLSMK